MTQQTDTHTSIGAIDFDHTSFAVRDAMSWARHLRAELGAVPIFGEALPEFRYLLMYVGDETSGTRVEFIEPTTHGFLTRYLDKHGEGPHHLTFTVPDVAKTAQAARELGLTIVGENYEHSPWQEAFILPDPAHRVVIQLSASDRSYPAAAELLSSTLRNVESQPSVQGASEPLWWTPVWTTDALRNSGIGPTRLGSADLDASHVLFASLLGGSASYIDDTVTFTWPGGAVCIHPSDSPGVTGIAVNDPGVETMLIGPAQLGGF